MCEIKQDEIERLVLLRGELDYAPEDAVYDAKMCPECGVRPLAGGMVCLSCSLSVDESSEVTNRSEGTT